MSVQTSGNVSLNDVDQEFGPYSSKSVQTYIGMDPLRIPSYYGQGARPVTGFDDYYGASIKTAKMMPSPNNDAYGRYGYARSNGYFYYLSESSQSGSSFGSITRTSNLATGSRVLACIVTNNAEADGSKSVTIGFSGGDSQYSGGWGTVHFYNGSISSTGQPSINWSQGAYGATGLSRVNQTLYTLPGTSPTVYAYRWNGTSGSVVTISNMIKSAAQNNNPIFVEFF